MFLDGRAQKDRVRAAVPVAMPGAQRLGRRRYIGFSRLTLARGQFTTEPAAPLLQSGDVEGTTCRLQEMNFDTMYGFIA